MSPLWYTAYLIKLHSTTGRNSQWTFTWIVQCSGPLWKALDSYPLLTTFVVPNWHTNLWDPDLQNRHLHILHPHPAPTSLPIHFPPTRAGAKFFSAQQSEFFKKGSWVPATCRAVEQECWFRHGFNLMFDIPSIYQYLIILLSTLIQWDQQISFSSKPGYLIFPWIPFSTILVGQTMILLQTLQMNCACQLPVWVRSPRRHQMRNGSK